LCTADERLGPEARWQAGRRWRTDFSTSKKSFSCCFSMLLVLLKHAVALPMNSACGMCSLAGVAGWLAGWRCSCSPLKLTFLGMPTGDSRISDSTCAQFINQCTGWLAGAGARSDCDLSGVEAGEGGGHRLSVCMSVSTGQAVIELTAPESMPNRWNVNTGLANFPDGSTLHTHTCTHARAARRQLQLTLPTAGPALHSSAESLPSARA
jgi:hypothetical protein